MSADIVSLPRLVTARSHEKLSDDSRLIRREEKVNILSGCNNVRFLSFFNHKFYADKHGYHYKCDHKKRDLLSVYDHKIHSILDLPTDDKWWFWLDDDAFFTNFDQRIEQLDLGFDDMLLIFPKSPVNLQGGWTYISSGNFFFKNTLEIKSFFLKVLSCDINEVRKWWDEKEYGMFTHGDQDRIVFELMKDLNLKEKTQITQFEIFNTRPYHFSKPSEHFLVHFAGVGEKAAAIEEFKNKFNFANAALIPQEFDYQIQNI